MFNGWQYFFAFNHAGHLLYYRRRRAQHKSGWLGRYSLHLLYTSAHPSHRRFCPPFAPTQTLFVRLAQLPIIPCQLLACFDIPCSKQRWIWHNRPNRAYSDHRMSRQWRTSVVCGLNSQPPDIPCQTTHSRSVLCSRHA